MISEQPDRLLATPEFVDDPYPAYRLLQAEYPVYWSNLWDAWVLTRHDDVLASLRDHEHFSSADRLIELLDKLPDGQQQEASPIREHFSTIGLIHADPPDHNRLRSLISKAFSARVIEGMRPRVQAVVDELLAAPLQRGTMDVLADLAYPLPAIIIAELLGAPPEDRDLFKQWSDEIVAFQGTGQAIPGAIARSSNGLVEMRRYLRGLFEQRRASPRDDLLGRLVAVEEEGSQLTTEELYSTCVTFLIAGHETTTSLIANGMYTLLCYPEPMKELRDNAALIPSAIEECLRFESPVQRAFRRVTKDVEFGGQRLRRGDIVLQLVGAANRDPSFFSEPDVFNIHRSPNRHIAFGSGIHFCIGAPLARLEASIAISTMLKRLPNLALDEPAIHWQAEKSLFRCVQSLPVTFTPGESSPATASQINT